MTQRQSEHISLFLPTMPASRSERKLAIALIAISAIFFAVCLPFARTPLARVDAFIPIYASALCINDAITALLLFGQFSILRSKAILALALGYTFTALMTAIHALSFPGLFSPAGLLGGGTQTTVWLYMFWHGGFPLFVIAYALLKDRRPVSASARPLLPAFALVFALVLSLVFVVSAGHPYLPVLLFQGQYTAALFITVFCIWGLSFAALAMLWRKRSYSVLDLWLLVVLCAWIFDIGLSTIFNAKRFDLGFYAGRIYGLLAASLVLWMLLLENTKLYAKLAGMHEQQRRKNAELESLNRDLESFGYSVSHDLRSPLLVISQFTNILEEEHASALDENGRRYLSLVKKSSAKMHSLLEGLLAFSKIGPKPLRTETVDVDGLVQDILQDLKSTHNGRNIRFDIAPLPPAVAEKALLRQVWWNLLENAVKYTRPRQDAVITVGHKAGDPAVYFVADNGVGFDMAYAHKLFGVFQRLHTQQEFEGTGVGLAIVERIVNKHGGHIWAESAKGSGTTFYFTLAPDPLTGIGNQP
ncbi:MASE4 domain-containing protein [Herbaspirillum sp.]|uniref:MASE4 domain-containing protein n=1 Tax=Herbaspirillum sp. TaxID=1890675 RepID=UPI001B1217BA|nr:MASE4 domain-containing protein [Herbaspirillum sp.]MBO9535174.1 MASE4 domain-containing protein [Herbaspirillum sp.]